MSVEKNKVKKKVKKKNAQSKHSGKESLTFRNLFMDVGVKRMYIQHSSLSCLYHAMAVYFSMCSFQHGIWCIQYIIIITYMYICSVVNTYFSFKRIRYFSSHKMARGCCHGLLHTRIHTYTPSPELNINGAIEFKVVFVIC